MNFAILFNLPLRQTVRGSKAYAQTFLVRQLQCHTAVHLLLKLQPHTDTHINRYHRVSLHVMHRQERIAQRVAVLKMYTKWD